MCDIINILRNRYVWYVIAYSDGGDLPRERLLFHIPWEGLQWTRIWTEGNTYPGTNYSGRECRSMGDFLSNSPTQVLQEEEVHAFGLPTSTSIGSQLTTLSDSKPRLWAWILHHTFLGDFPRTRNGICWLARCGYISHCIELLPTTMQQALCAETHCHRSRCKLLQLLSCCI